MADHKSIRKARMIPADHAWITVSPKIRHPCQRCGAGPGSNCGRWSPTGEWVVHQELHSVRGTSEEVELLKKPTFEAIYSKATSDRPNFKRHDIVNLDTLLEGT